jgi:mannosyl-3-phosphoglycerate synthase
MNSLISSKTGCGTEIIKTGNAGEHAMSLRLADILTYASGYAVEPQELISIFEGFGGILPIMQPTAAKHGVEIFQTRTRNPHLHEERGGRHLLVEMLLPSLGSVYHSPLCEKETKRLIIDELMQQKAIKPDAEPPKPRLIAPPQTINLKSFTSVMAEHMGLYSAFEEGA